MDSFKGILGQPQAIALLQAAIKHQRIAPAYLFAGAPGVGRGMTALAFAECLIGGQRSEARLRDRNHPDVLWIEPTYMDKGKMLTISEAIASGFQRRAAPQVRLEQIRQLSDFLSHPPLESDRLVVIIEASESMAEAAANGLLKTLEEPGRATIILIAPDVGSLLPTLVSRCQRIPFTRLNQADLQTILQQLGYTGLSEPILALAQGSPGSAIANQNQYQAINSELLKALEKLPRSPREALSIAKQISKELELESQIWLLDYLQQHFWRSLQTSTPLDRLESARKQLKGYVQPRLVWEVMLLELIGFA